MDKDRRTSGSAVAVVDPNGDLVYFYKMDNTQLGSIDIAINKARTAARLRRPTEDLWKAVQTQAGAYLATLGDFALARSCRASTKIRSVAGALMRDAGSAGMVRTRWLSRASDGSASPSTAEVRISNCATGSLQNARGTVYGSRSMVPCPARSCPSG